MLRSSGRLALAAFVLLLQACGSPDALTPVYDGVGSAAGAGGNVTAAQGGAAGSNGGASPGGSAGQLAASGSSAGGAVSCSSYADATGYTLPVHIKNSSNVTLYVGPQDSTCQVQRLFQVEDGARHALPSLDGCHTSCQALMQTGPVS